MKPEIWDTLKTLIETELKGVKKLQGSNPGGILEAKNLEGLHGLLTVAINLAEAERVILEVQEIQNSHKL
jgi:hypothetical protein